MEGFTLMWDVLKDFEAFKFIFKEVEAFVKIKSLLGGFYKNNEGF
jgi:hypothetical protein